MTKSKQKQRLISLRKKFGYGTDDYFADGLLENGVLCVPLKIGDKVCMVDTENQIRYDNCKIIGFMLSASTGEIECVFSALKEDGFISSFTNRAIGKTVFKTATINSVIENIPWKEAFLRTFLGGID